MPFKNEGCLTKKDLKARGWNDALITSLLGEPDAVKRLGYYGEAHLFIPLRVTQAETLPEFLTHKQGQAERKARAQKAVQTRRDKLLASIGDVRLPCLTPEKLLKNAVGNYNAVKSDYCERRQRWENFSHLEVQDVPLWPTPHAFRDRICVNYLRHCATGYDYLTRVTLPGKTGNVEAWGLWWTKFWDAVEREYPFLADEARRQWMARI